MNTQDKSERLKLLREELASLESELKTEPTTWQSGPDDYYGMYHATSGLLLGMLGAISSLLFNVVGSLAIGQHPLRLIQVYLTFPLGEKALSTEFETGVALAAGMCLYIGTGMLLGVPFQMALARFLPEGTLPARLVLTTVLGLLLWVVSFYFVLAWLQPLLFEGSWIVDPQVLPPWVGAATHIVFAWTMAIVFPWGKQQPYRRQTRYTNTSSDN